MQTVHADVSAAALKAIVEAKKRLDRPPVFAPSLNSHATPVTESEPGTDSEPEADDPVKDTPAPASDQADSSKPRADVIVVDIGPHEPTAADVASIDDLRKHSVAQIRPIGVPLMVEVSARDRKNAAVEKVWRAVEASRKK